jgi:hypothetical protein
MNQNIITIIGAIKGLKLMQENYSKKGVNYRILNNVIALLEELKKGNANVHDL